MTDPRIGTTLDGRYQIVGALASGGMGVVYRGERLGLGRSVAIKFLHAHMAADGAFLKRFAIEAKAMARLQHPHCAAVIDYGVDGREPYVVMDLVAGESLRSLLDSLPAASRGRLAAWRALGIMRQVLSGLAHAHAQGITHRDIKPDNIMVEATGSFGDQVRILDFGLAKLREGTSGLTTGFVVGTPSYMAPEQTLAQPVDERTDIYACGVVLFEMLTGEKPFRAGEAAWVLRMHREAPPPRLAEVAPEAGLSDEIEAAVLQALAKDPAHRFASAAAFATALDHVPEAATRPGSAPPPNTPAPVIVAARQAHAGLATAPTEWSHPQDAARAAPGPHATEHLAASQIEVVTTAATTPAAAVEHVGSAQLEAFAAALAGPERDRPLTPVPEAPDARFPSDRADTSLAGPHSRSARMASTEPPSEPPVAHSSEPSVAHSSEPSVARSSGPSLGPPVVPPPEPSLRPPPEPPPAVPGPAAPGRRRLWLGIGAGAGALALLIAIGLMGDDAPRAVVTGEPLPGPEGQYVIEVAAEPDEQPEPDGDDPVHPEQPDELAGAGDDVQATEVHPGRSYEDGARTPDPARAGVKSANQVAPPSLAQAEALLDQGRADQARKLLEKLRAQDRDNAELHYLLGKAYFQDLWVRDGLEAFRRAIELDPAYRSHHGLIKSAAAGLANDSHYYAVSRFLVRDIGRAARPALETMAARHHRDDVRERAKRALRQIR